MMYFKGSLEVSNDSKTVYPYSFAYSKRFSGEVSFRYSPHRFIIDLSQGLLCVVNIQPKVVLLESVSIKMYSLSNCTKCHIGILCKYIGIPGKGTRI